MRRLTHHTSVERTRHEVEQIYASKDRNIHDTTLDKGLLQEGERGVYQDGNGDVYFVTRVGDNIYYFAGFGSQPADTEALFKRYAFLMGAV